jgi:hypothetical protein
VKLLKWVLAGVLALLPLNAEAMQKHLGYATDNAGNVVSTASVRVKLAGTGTDATIYSDDGVNTKTNPFDVESADGSYYFYAANGLYDITLTASGYTFDSDDLEDVQLFDADDGVGTYPVKAYGLKGDGVTDDGPALQTLINSLTSGGVIVFTPGTYRIATCMASSGFYAGTTIRNDGGVISKECNGSLFSINSANNAMLDMVIDANGETYTGAVVTCKANSSVFEYSGGRITDGADPVFSFEDNGCSLSAFHDFYVTQHSSVVATGAVVKRTTSTVDTVASPRHFHHILAGSATWFADVNGFHGAYFDHVYSAGINIGANSLGNTLNNCRFAIPGGMTMTVSGNSTIATANEINSGILTVAAGFVYGIFANNVMDPAGTFTDSSIKTALATQPLVENPTLATGRQVTVIATADLPAAGASMNGRIVVEDAGAGDRNIIVYAGGQRFRIDGGANF